MPNRARVHLVAGARPNFMKIGPLYHVLAATEWCTPVLVHTGQHFSSEMSDVFLRDLELPAPEHRLQAKGVTHAEQTASVMTAYEALCLHDRPDWVVVAGDVNSTLAATLAAKKLNLPVAHLEAGLRSGDRSMPEEINRVMVDAVADIHWTPSADADQNLNHEGIAPDRIVRIGNIMIDAYRQLQGRIASDDTTSRLGLVPLTYAVVTMHRPVNVDEPARLSDVVDQIVTIAKTLPVAFPIHPRTRARLVASGLESCLHNPRILMLEPLGYIEFMNLVSNARLVVTDSGGIQEETSYLGIPCLTARESTERPVTITAGSNSLISTGEIASNVHRILAAPESRIRTSIPLWDGHAADRAAASLREKWAAR